MNLFALGWNLSGDLRKAILAELPRMVEVYPQLSTDTIWHYAKSPAFAASMHTAPRAAAPRNYVSKDEHGVTLYDGCLVDHRGDFNAFDAEALSSHWDQLLDALEGQFVVARIMNDPPNLQLLTDPFGVYQVYYLRYENAWLISNSVYFMTRASKVTALVLSCAVQSNIV